jgi:hypothetical protein
MAISTARNALSGIDGKLDASMVVNRDVLRPYMPFRSYVCPLVPRRPNGSRVAH